jgi:hypothetical protein
MVLGFDVVGETYFGGGSNNDGVYDGVDKKKI